MKRYIPGFIIGLLSLMCAGAVFASFEDNTGGARMRSMGGAFAAVADDSESVFAQPAGIACIAAPELSFTYGRLFLGLYDQSDISDGSFSTAFPVSKVISLGFGYKTTALKDVYSEDTALANVAFKLGRLASVGMNLKYLGVKYGADSYTAIDPVFANGYSKKAADGDAGIIITPAEWLKIGYTRKNIIGADLGLKDKSAASPQDYFGVSYTEPEFMVTGEMQRSNDNYRYIAGLEKLFASDLFRGRFGMGWGENNYRMLSVGLGFNFKQFVMDYAWVYPLSGIEQVSGTHYLTFTAKLGRSAASSAAAAPKAAAKTEVQPAIAETAAETVIPEGTVVMPPLVSPSDSQAVSASTEAVVCLPVPVVQKMVKENKKAEQIIQNDKEIKVVPSVSAPAGFRTYRTKAGETLMSLAEKFYGKRSDWVKIYQANKDHIEKGALKNGQTLIIP